MTLPDTYLRLTPGATDARGLVVFRLALWSGGREIDHLPAVSGQPGRQTLRRGADATPGAMEPIPEGIYSLGDSDAPNGINMAPDGSWGEGLGPLWIGCHPLPGYGPERAIGIHQDANSSYAPGTAACIGLLDRAGVERVREWFAGQDWPRTLVVDHGLGSVPKPPERGGVRRWKLYHHSGRTRILHDGQEQPASSLRVDAHSGRVGVALAGEKLADVLSVSVEVVYRQK